MHLECMAKLKRPQVSGGSRGGSESSLEPPLRQNYFIFMENFQKNQDRMVQITNGPPFKKSLNSASLFSSLDSLREEFMLPYEC